MSPGDTDFNPDDQNELRSFRSEVRRVLADQNVSLREIIARLRKVEDKQLTDDVATKTIAHLNETADTVRSAAALDWRWRIGIAVGVLTAIGVGILNLIQQHVHP